MRIFFPIAAFSLVAFLCPAAVAETSEERQACIGDAFRGCWAAIPNRDDVLHCLLTNKSRISDDCRAVLDSHARSHSHRITRSKRAMRSE